MCWVLLLPVLPTCLLTDLYCAPRLPCPLVQPGVPGGALACLQARVQPRLHSTFSTFSARQVHGSGCWLPELSADPLND